MRLEKEAAGRCTSSARWKAAGSKADGEGRVSKWTVMQCLLFGEAEVLTVTEGLKSHN
jgi:hypothetical protein